ncbi:MAG: hypothetical protein KDC44_07220, partial [Phaeodactylibacter sp.]|nr:hypothetical protein [Phaeodactylibacter sp.]
MTTRRYHYARHRRQLRFLIKQYNRQDSQGLRLQLADRILQLCRRLTGVFSEQQLRRIFSGAAFGLLLSWAPLQAQPFATFQENPFQIVSNNTLMFNTFVDIDNDGDLDMFTAGPAENFGAPDIN